MSTEYVWAKWGASRGLSAQVAGEELDRIRQRSNGVLTAEGVVKASRSKRAVLHSVFEWDDATAAEDFRTHQARNLINHVQVKITNGEELPPVRAFVNVVPDLEEQGYSSIQDVLADPDMARRHMEQALSEMKSVRRRYGNLQAVAKALTPAIEVIEKELEMAA